MERAHQILETVFGFKSFRPHQGPIVEALISGRNVLALMPTGGGKSLCYQVPALLREGTAIVVSPLIALMQDQVDALRQAGVDAAFLNSTLDTWAQREIEDQLVTGQLDLLYIAPERLMTERMLSTLQNVRLSLFAIDEAHCVSQWGHDFRPEYRKLGVLADLFQGIPRVALTATADSRTRTDIVSELRLEDAERFVASFDRPNIRYTITEGGGNARDRLWQFISAEHPRDAGIIYCLSRKKVEETAAWLSTQGRTALAYHAGLTADQRQRHQQRFLREDGVIIVATIAFGMGIDKPDVRFVAHLNLPKSIEAYYQETGRAGRDGECSNAWMAYRVGDGMTYRQWIDQSEASDDYKRISHQKLDALFALCEMANCRRQALLGYFGETLNEPCGNCDNCVAPPETHDATEAARKALSCVYRTGQRYGARYIVDVLTGKDDQRISANGHDRLSTFGIGTEMTAAEWQALVRQLIGEGHLEARPERYGGLALTAKCRPLLRGEARFMLRRRKGASEGKRTRERRRDDGLARGDRALFEALRGMRSRLAAEQGVPPYVICHDRSLKEMASRRPRDRAALHDINGLGEAKISRYGDAFITAVTRLDGHEMLSSRLSESLNKTLALHLLGFSAEEIARTRGLEPTTVHGHYAEAIEAGLISADEVLGLDEAEAEEIRNAFENTRALETGRLQPAFEALGGRFDYGILKCVLAELA